MKRITSRFVLLIATAAVLPLVVYGFVSIRSLRDGTHLSVQAGNKNVARQVADQLSLYMRHNIRVLQAVGSGLGSTAQTPWQQERALKNFVLDFPEFREITVFNNGGQPLATSAIGKNRLTVPEEARRRPQPLDRKSVV